MTLLSSGSFLDVVLASAGDRLYASAADGSVTTFDIATGQQLGQWKVGFDLGGMDVSSDGRYLLAAEKQLQNVTGSGASDTASAVVHRLDLSTGQVTDFSKPVRTSERSFFDVAFAADGKAVLSSLGVTVPSVLDLATGVFSSGGVLGTLSSSADGSTVLATGVNSTLAQFELRGANGAVIASHSAQSEGVAGVYFGVQALAPDGRWVAEYAKGYGTFSQGQLNIYDGQLKPVVDLTAKYADLSGRIAGLDFSADGRVLYLLDVNSDRVMLVSTVDWSIQGYVSFETDLKIGALASYPERSGAYGDRLSVSADGHNLVAFGDNGVVVIDLSKAALIPATGEADHLRGSAGADWLDGLGGNDWLEGLNGDDRLVGSSGADTLDGGAGNDVLQGLVGADSLVGGDGDDLLQAGGGDDFVDGGDGADSLDGSEGQDILWGGLGRDMIWGGADFDQINGNMGDDIAYGGEGDDWVVGGKDNDLLYGDNGADIVYGNLGADTCYGGDGADWVRGGQGDDVIDGGAGNDWMAGDRGNDTVTGGAGADIFYFFGGAGVDRVMDFSAAAGDRVLLDPGQAYVLSYTAEGAVIDLGGGDQMILMGVTQTTMGDWLSH